MVQTLSDSRTAALSFLSTRQNEDGGWGYLSTHASSVEPTAAAVLAFAGSQNHVTTLRGALEWLQHTQNADGGWGISAADTESTWQSAWALLALAKTGALAGERERATNRLLTTEQLALSIEGQQAMQELLNLDPSLQGWPWYQGEASWVEPTALTLMALGQSSHSEELPARTESAVQYLLDRRCPTGGWNVGSPSMLGALLPARAIPTALALLALARYAPDSILADDINALENDMLLDSGALALAMGLIALRQLGQTDEDANTRLQALQSEDGSWDQNAFHTALALIATRAPFCGLWERCNEE
jgi:hypothetical protein